MTENLDGAASRNFHLTDRRNTPQLHTSVRWPDRGRRRWGWSPHKTESGVSRTEGSCHPPQTSPHLRERQIGSSAVPANHDFTVLEQPAKTTNQQSSERKVASIASDKRAFLIGPWDVPLYQVTRDSAITLPTGYQELRTYWCPGKECKGNFEMLTGWPGTNLHFKKGRISYLEPSSS